MITTIILLSLVIAIACVVLVFLGVFALPILDIAIFIMMVSIVAGIVRFFKKLFSGKKDKKEES